FGPLKFFEKNDPFHDIDLLNSLSPLAEQISGQLGIEPADIGLTSLELPTRYDNPLASHILTALLIALKIPAGPLTGTQVSFQNMHAYRLEASTHMRLSSRSQASS